MGLLTVSGSSVVASSISMPSTTTSSGIAVFSGTTGGGFLNTGITIDPSNKITLPSGAYIVNTVSGINDLGTAALPFCCLYSNYVEVSGSSIPPSANNYVFSYDTTNQTVGTANTFQDITFSNNGQINGWTHTAATANFTCGKSGLYLVTYEAVGTRTANSSSTIEIRALFNGREVPGSQCGNTIPTNKYTFTMARSFILSATTAQILKLQLTATTTSGGIISVGANATTRPSITITVYRLWM